VWLGEWKVSRGPYALFEQRLQRSVQEQYRWGAAFWQWKISCGNPHLYSNPFDPTPFPVTGTLNPVHCPDGQPRRAPSDLREGLSRPVPRAVPGKFRTLRTSSGSAIALSGSQPKCRRKHRHHPSKGACRLVIWFSQRPTTRVRGRHLGKLKSTRTDGGWLLRARVRGRYRIESATPR
jgi:endoglycosylceramidase